MIRTLAGSVQRGSVGGPDEKLLIEAGAGSDISLNIHQSPLRGYDRAGDDLLIPLDGQMIVLGGYFGATGGEENRLFLSFDGTLNEVSFVEAEGGALFAHYGPTESWRKRSPSDALIFVEDPVVSAEAPYAGDDDAVANLAAPLPGATGLGTADLARAGLLGAAVLVIGGNGRGDVGPSRMAPTV